MNKKIILLSLFMILFSSLVYSETLIQFADGTINNAYYTSTYNTEINCQGFYLTGDYEFYELTNMTIPLSRNYGAWSDGTEIYTWIEGGTYGNTPNGSIYGSMNTISVGTPATFIPSTNYLAPTDKELSFNNTDPPIIANNTYYYACLSADGTTQHLASSQYCVPAPPPSDMVECRKSSGSWACPTTPNKCHIEDFLLEGIEYNPSAPTVSYQQVKIINKWNSANIQNFNITLNNSDWNLTQADGIAYFNNLSGSYEFTGELTNYFDVSGVTVENTTVTYNTSQSVINFDCYEKITNNSLTCVNGTIYPNAGSYNMTIGVSGYYDVTQEETITALDNKTINFTGFYNSWVNINATDQTDDSSISNFTIIITDINNGWTDTLVADGTDLNISLIEGRNFSLEIQAYGYEYKTHNLTNISKDFYEFELYTANSVLINIFKESDGSRIYENITVRFTDPNSTITEYETNTSIQYVDNLSIGNYTIAFISTNYSTRTYEITVGNNTFQTLNVYLVDDGLGSTVFEFQNKNTGATLDGVTLTIEKVINSTWTVVEVLNSDVTGRTSFDYIDDDTYRFTASISGYTTKAWTLDPILFSSYTIKLEPTITQTDESDYSGLNIYYTPSIYYNDLNNSISFTFVSPYGEFLSYGFNATFDSNVNSSSGSNAYGGTITANLEITGATESDLVVVKYYYRLSDGDNKTYSKTFTIDNSDAHAGTMLKGLSEHYGLGIFERVLIVVILTLLVVGAGSYYGGAMAGGLLGLFLFGFFAYTTFIPLYSVVVSMIVLFIILTWRSSL